MMARRCAARDCIASIKRWGRRDAFGQALVAADEDVTDDRRPRLHFKLKRPFPLLLDALAKPPTSCPFIMPERLANTDPFQHVARRWAAAPSASSQASACRAPRSPIERFAGYVPRPARRAVADRRGRRSSHFDRVEWQIIPDASTAAAALQSGEIDWWEQIDAGSQASCSRRAPQRDGRDRHTLRLHRLPASTTSIRPSTIPRSAAPSSAPINQEDF